MKWNEKHPLSSSYYTNSHPTTILFFSIQVSSQKISRVNIVTPLVKKKNLFLNQWWNVWFCWLCCQHLWSRCSNKLKNTSALWRPPLPKNRWWWKSSSSSSSWIWRVVMMGVPGWARIPLLPVKQEVCLLPVSCFFENQNPTWTAHSFKNNPTDSFHISNGEKQQQNCCFLFSFFLHYQHLHFSDWSTQLQLHHDEPGDDRSYQLLYSFYITYLCLVYLLTIVFWVDRIPRKK